MKWLSAALLVLALGCDGSSSVTYVPYTMHAYVTVKCESIDCVSSALSELNSFGVENGLKSQRAVLPREGRQVQQYLLVHPSGIRLNASNFQHAATLLITVSSPPDVRDPPWQDVLQSLVDHIETRLSRPVLVEFPGGGTE